MQRTPKLREIAGEFFKQFGLDLVLVHDEKIKKIKIQKESDGIFIHFPLFFSCRYTATDDFPLGGYLF
jgi:hypothetical protein